MFQLQPSDFQLSLNKNSTATDWKMTSMNISNICNTSKRFTRVLNGTSNRHRGSKSNTSLKILKQQHRENERNRHQGLNASINKMVQRVPGVGSFSRGSKIDKLRKVIAYILYLEKHVETICLELGTTMGAMSVGLIKPILKRAVVTRRRRRGNLNKVPRKKQPQLNSSMNSTEASEQLLADCRREFDIEMEMDNENEDMQTDSQEPVAYDRKSPDSDNISLSFSDFLDDERLLVTATEKACRAISEKTSPKLLMKQPVLRVARINSLPISTSLKENVASDTKTRLRRAYLVVLPRLTQADRMIGSMKNCWAGDGEKSKDTFQYKEPMFEVCQSLDAGPVQVIQAAVTGKDRHFQRYFFITFRYSDN